MGIIISVCVQKHMLYCAVYLLILSGFVVKRALLCPAAPLVNETDVDFLLEDGKTGKGKYEGTG